MSKNPWIDLPKSPPYILPRDGPLLDQFERKYAGELQYESLPEPYIGDPLSASVVVLGLNPGHRPDDAAWHSRPMFVRRWKDNILHRRRKYRFYALDPELAQSPVARWWSARFRQLLSQVGQEHLSNKIAAIEWFPYHSKNAAHTKKFFSSLPPLKSQEYSFKIAASALSDRRKVVVVFWGTEAWSLWNNSVASLGSGLKNAIRLTNPQCAHLTPGNMETSDFTRLVKALRD